VKIEPAPNIDLETRARGIGVILNISGPINKPNMTPRSDPPFSDVQALGAAVWYCIFCYFPEVDGAS